MQLANGTDIYTVSKLLTHSNLATIQIYADVVSELKRDAAGRISLKVEENSEDEDTAMPAASDNGDGQHDNKTLAH